MGRPLNINKEDIVGIWKVLTDPEVPQDKKTHSKYAWCECQICHKEIKYLRCSEIKDRGSKCTRKSTKGTTFNPKIKSMSFLDWCKKNNDYSLIDRWDYDLNKYKPNEISYKSTKEIWVKCPEGRHKSRTISLGSYTSGGSPCDCFYCKLENNSFGKWCENNKLYLLELWDCDLNDCSPYDILSGSSKKYYFKCPRGLHNSILKQISKITCRGDDIYCPECHSIGQFIIDKYGEGGLELLWDYQKNTQSPFEVMAGSHKKVYINCLENLNHGSFPIACSNYTKERGCPKCKQDNFSSNLQKLIVKYIKDTYNYDILHEYECLLHCENPKTGFEMPYDNQVIIDEETFLFIECMGEQHYKINGLTRNAAKKHKITPEKELEEQQWRDEYKKQYVLGNGYHYLAIPYTTERNDQYKFLIDSKISEILSLNSDYDITSKLQLFRRRYAQNVQQTQ